jgi:hypothetical protein
MPRILRLAKSTDFLSTRTIVPDLYYLFVRSNYPPLARPVVHIQRQFIGINGVASENLA